MQFDGRRYRPMGITDLFDEAFDLYKKNFAALMLITALVYVPAGGVASLYFMGWGSIFGGPSAPPVLPQLDHLFDSFGVVAGAYALAGPPYALLIGLMVGAIGGAISDAYHGRPVRVWSSFARGAAAAIPIGITLLIWVPVIVGGYALFVLPGFIANMVCGMHLMSGQAAVEERLRNPVAATRRSWRLTSGDYMRILGACTLLAVIVASLIGTVEAILALVATAVVSGAVPFIPLLEAHSEVTQWIAINITVMLVIPFVVTVLAMLYYDARIRKEGYDMDILARSLGYPEVVAKPAQTKASWLNRKTKAANP